MNQQNKPTTAGEALLGLILFVIFFAIIFWIINGYVDDKVKPKNPSLQSKCMSMGGFYDDDAGECWVNGYRK